MVSESTVKKCVPAIKGPLVLFLIALSLIALISGNSLVAEAAEINWPADFVAHKDDASKAPGHMGGTPVYFGNYGGNPILWNTVDTSEAGTIKLWTKTRIKGKAPYNSTANHMQWSGSTLCSWLNGTAEGSFLYDAFKRDEANAMATYGATETTNRRFTIDVSQKVVLPSLEEIGNDMGMGAWGINPSTRGLGDMWWLRSPGADSNNKTAVNVTAGGSVSSYGATVNGNPGLYVRPAFKLDLSSVLFTSAAEGLNGKSQATVGGGFIAAAVPSGAVKLTLKNPTLSLSSADLDKSAVKPGGSVKVSFSGAATGANKYVSCVLANNSGAITHYAKLSDAENSTDVLLTLPANLANGNYTLYVFNEEANGDRLTDYASTPISLPLSVDSTIKPTITSAAPSDNANPLSGEVVIAFSQAMERLSPGTVTLNGSRLDAGTWSESIPGGGYDTYTVPYSDLPEKTLYVVSVEGFVDVSGNMMDPDATHIFATGDFTKPVVAAVAPSGIKEPFSGEAVIVFSEAMDVEKVGAVRLNSTLLDAGTWSESVIGKGYDTYTVPFANLTEKTLYKVTVSGFADVVGNIMDADDTYSFTTAASLSFDCWFEGSNAYTKGGSEPIVFVVDKEQALFVRIEIDEADVPSPNASGESKPTKVTITPDYLETLTIGSHSIEQFFSDGTSGKGVFEVKAAASDDDKQPDDTAQSDDKQSDDTGQPDDIAQPDDRQSDGTAQPDDTGQPDDKQPDDSQPGDTAQPDDTGQPSKKEQPSDHKKSQGSKPVLLASTGDILPVLPLMFVAVLCSLIVFVAQKRRIR